MELQGFAIFAKILCGYRNKVVTIF